MSVFMVPAPCVLRLKTCVGDINFYELTDGVMTVYPGDSIEFNNDITTAKKKVLVWLKDCALVKLSILCKALEKELE